MREQVVAQKVGNRSGIGKESIGAAGQRPAKRGSRLNRLAARFRIAAGLRATRVADRRALRSSA